MRVGLRGVAQDGDVAGPLERVDRGTAAHGVERALLPVRRDAVPELHDHFTGQVVEPLRRRVDEGGGARRRHHVHRRGRELPGEPRRTDGDRRAQCQQQDSHACSDRHRSSGHRRLPSDHDAITLTPDFADRGRPPEAEAHERERQAIGLDPGGAGLVAEEPLARVVLQRQILVGERRVRAQHVGELAGGAPRPDVRQEPHPQDRDRLVILLRGARGGGETADGVAHAGQRVLHRRGLAQVDPGDADVRDVVELGRRDGAVLERPGESFICHRAQFSG